FLFPYFYFQPQPLYEPIAWNGLFALINGVQIYFLYLERRPVQLDDDEEKLYLMAFRCLTRREFKKLLSVGDWWTLPENKVLIEQGEEPDQVVILMEGEVCTYVDDRKVARVRPGQFLGEMGFFTGEKTEADVWTDTDVKMYCWDMDRLTDFLDENPGIKNALQTTLGKDLAAKLQAARNKESEAEVS
ncbi:MAG: Crp/Fnr family transcriptional regulator, partial [bacterium]